MDLAMPGGPRGHESIHLMGRHDAFFRAVPNATHGGPRLLELQGLLISARPRKVLGEVHPAGSRPRTWCAPVGSISYASLARQRRVRGFRCGRMLHMPAICSSTMQKGRRSVPLETSLSPRFSAASGSNRIHGISLVSSYDRGRGSAARTGPHSCSCVHQCVNLTPGAAESPAPRAWTPWLRIRKSIVGDRRLLWYAYGGPRENS